MLINSFTGMSPFMLLQIIRLNETFGAHFAYEWPFPCVNLFVHSQIVLSSKPFRANITLKMFLSNVNISMLIEQIFCCKFYTEMVFHQYESFHVFSNHMIAQNIFHKIHIETSFHLSETFCVLSIYDFF